VEELAGFQKGKREGKKRGGLRIVEKKWGGPTDETSGETGQNQQEKKKGNSNNGGGTRRSHSTDRMQSKETIKP